MSSRPRRRTPVWWRLALLALATVACAAPPVEWAAERAAAPLTDGPAALTVDGILRPDTLAALAGRLAPPPMPACAGSLRVAAAGSTLFRVWWAPRPDSGARLLAARSADGGRSWTLPAAVDTTDVGVGGCGRAPAAIAADSASGYVHVTYALQAAEGPGLFFSHSMDGGVTFHAPVPILYGEHLGHTSVAADGDLVVVGFEDPNSRTPRIGLALSRTMGHIFEHRILPVSDGHGRASRPLTAARGRRIAVGWVQDGAPTTLAVRSGTVR